jgi:type II secretory pathway pseudopilin PulG
MKTPAKKEASQSWCGFSRGFSTIEIVISTAIMSVIGLTITAIMLQQNDQQQRAKFDGTLLSVRHQVISLIQDNKAWMLTKQDTATWASINKSSNDSTNTNVFSCLNAADPRTACAGQVLPFRVYDNSGNMVFYDAEGHGDTTQGFTVEGNPCNQYPNGNCRLQVQLRWHPLIGAHSVQDSLDMSVRVAGVNDHLEVVAPPWMKTLNINGYALQAQLRTIASYISDTPGTSCPKTCPPPLMYVGQGFVPPCSTNPGPDACGCAPPSSVMQCPPTTTTVPACSQTDLNNLVAAMTPTLSATNSAISAACADASIPDPNASYNNALSSSYWQVRFLVTCGNRYCTSQGYDTGRVLNFDAGGLGKAVNVQCVGGPPPSSFSSACQTIVNTTKVVQYNSTTRNAIISSCSDPVLTDINSLETVGTCFCKAQDPTYVSGIVVDMFYATGSAGVQCYRDGTSYSSLFH